ncbi:peroxiredoxin [Pedobacter cryoconitis]|uniref:Peroxiredoxin n=1 Tax=Pedobacter cryoconitis TaxID=188932 RepID=A0A7W8ZHV7_9SPHI|nr:TlpA disulfide reductase family protein [Pedobacter cryoconitis]MBB5634190.1 peroxiredoxin [Pedobacter cryoconitis]
MKASTLILGLISLSFFANAQQKKGGYTINGNILGLKSPYVYLSVNGKSDSAAVKDGKFSYKGENVTAPSKVTLHNKVVRLGTFYVENVPVTIKGDLDKPDDIIITGGKTQTDNNELSASKKNIDEQLNKIYEAWGTANKAKDPVALAKADKEMEPLEEHSKQLTIEFIKTHPASYVSLEKINELTYELDYAAVSGLFQGLSPVIKASGAGKKVETSLAVLKKGSNGQKMIDFTQNNPSGKPVSFSSFKGKYVLVDFWASWCGPCRGENPNVVKAYNRFSPKGFTVLGVSLDQDGTKWKKAIEDDKLPWDQVSELNGWKNEVAKYYGINGIPSNYLVDPNGIIVARNLRGEQLTKKLEELLP